MASKKHKKPEKARKKRTKTLKQEPTTEPSPILELPTCILADILSRLSFKTLSICRCVCKTWFHLIASPDFDNLRLQRSQPEVLLRGNFRYSGSITLYFLDLKTILTASLPGHYRLAGKRISLPKIGEGYDKGYKHLSVEYDIVNSCNGLMCLREKYDIDSFIVLNPITAEFIIIPKSARKKSVWSKVVCGFGCSLRSNVYKIVRMFYSDSNRPDGIVEVHTIGTDSWRTLGNVCWSVNDIHTEFLNGALHWLNCGTREWGSIEAFDVEDEQFRVFLPPSGLIGKLKNKLRIYSITMGVLSGRLMICQVYEAHVDIWVMKDYGFHESWTKTSSFDVPSFNSYKPFTYLLNGDLVLQPHCRSLEFYNPIEKRLRQFRMYEHRSDKFEAITFAPTFSSLSDVLGSCNLAVHNFKTRWTESGLLEDVDGLMSFLELSKGISSARGRRK